MKLKISQTNLQSLVGRLASAVSEKNIAQLGIRAENNVLEVALIDRVLAVYCKFSCSVIQSGTAFVSAPFFLDIVRELPSGEVDLIVQDSSLVINTHDPDGFTIRIPKFDDLSWKEPPTWGKTSFREEIPSEKLSYMIEQMQFCVAQESSRNYGSVGYLQRGRGALRLVGTDGFRLSMCDIVSNGELSPSLGEGVCLSKRALNELNKLCLEGAENVELALAEDRTTLLASVPDYKIYVLLSATSYPSYEGVLPQASPNRATVSRLALLGAVRRVLLAAGKSRSLQLSFVPGRLTLSSRSVGSSESRESLTLPDYSGQACQLVLNGKYISDVLVTAVCSDLTFHFRSEEDPVLVVPESELKDCHSRHVLVPIREGENQNADHG